MSSCPLKSVRDTRIECKPGDCKWGVEDNCIMKSLGMELAHVKAELHGIKSELTEKLAAIASGVK